MLLPWLAFTIKGVEHGWLARCQFKVTGWGIMLIMLNPITHSLFNAYNHARVIIIAVNLMQNK